jgi:hypothetical protein
MPDFPSRKSELVICVTEVAKGYACNEAWEAAFRPHRPAPDVLDFLNSIGMSLLIPLEITPAARAVIGNNDLKEVQQSTLVDSFAPPGFESPVLSGALSLVHNALGIRHDGIVDENVEMILRSKQRADVAIQRKIGLLGALDGLSHLRISGMHQISHLVTHLLLPERRASECIHRCGSQSGMYSCRDHTTNPGPSAWLTEWAYVSPNLSQIHFTIATDNVIAVYVLVRMFFVIMHQIVSFPTCEALR